MTDKVKLIIEIPKEDYEFTKGAKAARVFPSEYYVKLILNGIPLPKGHGRLIDADELENHLKEDADEWDEYALARVEDAPTVIGKESEVDFPQAKDIEPTVKSFSKVLDNKLISNAIEEERCCICGGVKRFGICQDCGSDMRGKDE